MVGGYVEREIRVVAEVRSARLVAFLRCERFAVNFAGATDERKKGRLARDAGGGRRRHHVTHLDDGVSYCGHGNINVHTHMVDIDPHNHSILNAILMPTIMYLSFVVPSSFYHASGRPEPLLRPRRVPPRVPPLSLAILHPPPLQPQPPQTNSWLSLLLLLPVVGLKRRPSTPHAPFPLRTASL